jgi:hypothetical protein
VLEEDDQRVAAVDLDGSARTAWERDAVPPRAMCFDAPTGRGPVVLNTPTGDVRLLEEDGSWRGWQETPWIDRVGWLRGDDRIVVSTMGRRVEFRDERDDPRLRLVGGTTRWRRPDGGLVVEREGRLLDLPRDSAVRADAVVLATAAGLEVYDRDGERVCSLGPAPAGLYPEGAQVSQDGGRVLVRYGAELVGGRVSHVSGLARLHDGRTGALLAETRTTAWSTARGAALSPDGSRHAVVRPDQSTVLLDDHGRVVSPGLSREGAVVVSLAFDARGERLAVGHDDGSLDVRRADGSLVLSLGPREGGIHAAFTPDGRRLLTWTMRGFVSLWPFDVDEALALARARTTRALTAEERERYARLLPPAATTR